jgi:uncharacterized membrane protein YhaH (DUF805 family)
MPNSNTEDLFASNKTDSLYQPLLGSPQVKIPSYPYDVSAQKQQAKGMQDSELERLFRLYRYVIYVYLFINGIQLLKGSFDLVQSPSGEKAFAVTVTIFSFLVWFLGNHAIMFRSARDQFRFQGLLILFMVYHAVICSQIVQDSYIVIPNLTLSSFGLNAVFGILIPVLVYYRADELRLIFEHSYPRSALKL